MVIILRAQNVGRYKDVDESMEKTGKGTEALSSVCYASGAVLSALHHGIWFFQISS